MENYKLIPNRSNDVATIGTLYHFESDGASIIEFLFPLICMEKYSRKHFFCRFRKFHKEKKLRILNYTFKFFELFIGHLFFVFPGQLSLQLSIGQHGRGADQELQSDGLADQGEFVVPVEG